MGQIRLRNLISIDKSRGIQKSNERLDFDNLIARDPLVINSNGVCPSLHNK